MAAPYSIDLRARVVAAYRSGLSRADVAERFQVSASSVQRWSRLDRQNGSVAAKPMGGKRPFALLEQRDWILARIKERPDLPLRDLLAEVRQRHGGARYYALWNIVKRADLSFKKRARIDGPPMAVETDHAILNRRGAAEGFLVDLTP